jgi:transposase-like protein
MEELQMVDGGKYRKYTKEFRESALRRLSATAKVSELCRELGISRQLLYQWRERGEREARKRSIGSEQRLRQENAQLKKVLLRRTLEVDFLKAACAKVEALRQSITGSGATASGKRSGN